MPYSDTLNIYLHFNLFSWIIFFSVLTFVYVFFLNCDHGEIFEHEKSNEIKLPKKHFCTYSFFYDNMCLHTLTWISYFLTWNFHLTNPNKMAALLLKLSKEFTWQLYIYSCNYNLWLTSLVYNDQMLSYKMPLIIIYNILPNNSSLVIKITSRLTDWDPDKV